MEVQKATKHEKFTLGIYFDLPQENEMKSPWQWPVIVSESKEKKMLYSYEVEKNPNFFPPAFVCCYFAVQWNVK